MKRRTWFFARVGGETFDGTGFRVRVFGQPCRLTNGMRGVMHRNFNVTQCSNESVRAHKGEAWSVTEPVSGVRMAWGKTRAETLRCANENMAKANLSVGGISWMEFYLRSAAVAATERHFYNNGKRIPQSIVEKYYAKQRGVDNGKERAGTTRSAQTSRDTPDAPDAGAGG